MAAEGSYRCTCTLHSRASLITGEDETIAEPLHELGVASKEDHPMGIRARKNPLDPREVRMDGRDTFLGMEQHAQRIAHMEIPPLQSL
jgi:hypothetical protein